jgi:hypothetical protein
MNHEDKAERYDAVEMIAEAAELRPHGAAEASEGWAWDAVMLDPGVSKNGRYYSPEFIRESAPLFEGAPAYVDHAEPGAGASVRDLAGKWDGVSANEGAGQMRGTLRILKSEAWLRDKLVAAAEAKLTIGVSINAFVAFDRGRRDGKDVMVARKLIAELPRSVDVVMVAGAGGRILRAVASADVEAELAAVLEKFCKTSSLPQSGKENPAPNTEQKEQPPMEETKPAAPDSGAAADKAAVTAVTESVRALESRVQEAERNQKIAEGRLLLNDKLAASKLATPLAKLVRERYEGQLVTAEALDAEITRVREAYAAMVPSPTRATGAPVAEVGYDTREKMEIALDRCFGLTKQYKQVNEGGVMRLVEAGDLDSSIPRFSGLREAYIAFTGDHEISGVSSAAMIRRITEEWNNAGFPNALGNTLYRRMIADYEQADYGLNLLCPPGEPHRVRLQDFRTHEIVRVGYVGDLTVVDPEAVDWPEIAAPTDEKATIAAVQFGGIVTVTRKTIINDDLGLVMKVADRLGRAARRTLAQRLFNLAINNAAIYDGVTFYHATSHGANLRTVALSAAESDTIRTGMRDQTEKDSGKKIGVGPYIQVVPHALEGTAKAENIREFLDSNMAPNKVRFMYGPNSERIIVSPLLSDANDHYAFANPQEVQTFEIGFLQGREQPDLLLQDNPTVDKVFTGDRIRWKVRHEYEVTVVDFRGAAKNAVA